MGPTPSMLPSSGEPVGPWAHLISPLGSGRVSVSFSRAFSFPSNGVSIDVLNVSWADPAPLCEVLVFPRHGSIQCVPLG